jgi:hypothetical protein
LARTGTVGPKTTAEAAAVTRSGKPRGGYAKKPEDEDSSDDKKSNKKAGGGGGGGDGSDPDDGSDSSSIVMMRTRMRLMKTVGAMAPSLMSNLKTRNARGTPLVGIPRRRAWLKVFAVAFVLFARCNPRMLAVLFASSASLL